MPFLARYCEVWPAVAFARESLSGRKIHFPDDPIEYRTVIPRPVNWNTYLNVDSIPGLSEDERLALNVRIAL